MEMKYLSKDGLIYLWSQVKVQLSTKVDKVDGKMLSDNNYTTAEKNKLAAIAAGADVSLIREIKLNGSVVAPNGNKSVSLTVITAADVDNKIATAVSGISTIKIEKVAALPSTGATNVIYLVANGKPGNNIYDEYIWQDGKWEVIGSTQIDLSNYVTFSDLSAISNSEIDTVMAM